MANLEDSASEYSHKWWCAEITKSEKRLDEKWRNDADDIVDRYLDERGGTERSLADLDNGPQKRYNIFWANVQIIKSALYATPPRPVVARAHQDSKDDVARVAALILQRILQYDFEKNSSDIHEAIKMAVEDRLIPGLGQCWLRYEVETEPTPPVLDPVTRQEIAPAGLKIVKESVATDYVHWRDFVYSPVRTWNEKWWLGRRLWMRKKAFIRKFSEAKWKMVEDKAKETKTREGRLPKGFSNGRAEIFEIWCEDSNKVYWIHTGIEEILAEKSDFLELNEFYPCPKPLLATHTTNDFSPRADYSMAKDQYEELDTLNARIGILTQALRVVGVYDKTNTEIGKILTGGEFNMIPVDNWAAFAEQGGLTGTIDWFPVDVIAGVLEKLMIQRQAVIGQIYELTSISDIQRGASNPRETLGAQKLKAQYSSVRLQLSQQDVSEFVAQLLHVKCEIMCKMFQPETLKKLSQIEHTDSAQFADAAIELLKNYDQSHYRIVISEEQLSLADYNAERERRTELITAIGQFVSQAGQMAQSYPQVMPYLLMIVQWVVASFRGSEDIETVLDGAIAAAQQPQPPQESGGADNNPGQAAQAQAKVQVAQIAAQTDQQKLALEAKIAEDKNQTAVLLKQMDLGLEDKRLQQDAIGMTLDMEAGDRDREASAEAARLAAAAKGNTE